MMHTTYYRAYTVLMADLEKLISAGMDESPEAEVLREQMDPLWWSMSVEERLALNADVRLPSFLTR